MIGQETENLIGFLVFTFYLFKPTLFKLIHQNPTLIFFSLFFFLFAEILLYVLTQKCLKVVVCLKLSSLQ